MLDNGTGVEQIYVTPAGTRAHEGERLGFCEFKAGDGVPTKFRCAYRTHDIGPRTET